MSVASTHRGPTGTPTARRYAERQIALDAPTGKAKKVWAQQNLGTKNSRVPRESFSESPAWPRPLPPQILVVEGISSRENRRRVAQHSHERRPNVVCATPCALKSWLYCAVARVAPLISCLKRQHSTRTVRLEELDDSKNCRSHSKLCHGKQMIPYDE